MAGIVFAAAAIGLVLTSIRVWQLNGRRHLLHALSLVSAAIGILAWPTSNALAIDRALHVPGLGHVLTDSLIPLTLLLQFRFASQLSGRWSSRRRLLFAVGLGLIAIHAALWAVDEITVAGDRTHLWYDHYYGTPVQILVTYIVLSASLLFAAVCCLRGYLPSVVATQHRRERFTALGISAIALGAAVYSPLPAAQSIASAAGMKPTFVTAFTIPIMAATTAVALVTVLGLLVGRRVWSAIERRLWAAIISRAMSDQRLRDLIRRQSEQQERRHMHMVNLAVAIDDRLLRIRRDYAAARAVEQVTTACTKRRIGLERRKVAREAVRIITLDYDNVVEEPFYDEDELDEQKGLAEYYLLHADGSYFFDDVYKVAFLAVGGEGLLAELNAPEEFEFEAWHYKLAAIVAEAVETYTKEKRAQCLDNGEAAKGA